MGSISKVRQL